MGADLLLAWTVLPVDQDGKVITKWDLIKDAVELRAIDYVAAHNLDVHGSYVADLYCVDNEKDLTARLIESAEAVMDATVNYYRNVCTFKPPMSERKILACGGTSWGDSPGEPFDDVIGIGETELFNEPFVVSKETP